MIVFDHLAAAADFIEAVDVIEGDYVGMFRIDGRVVRAETLHEDVRLILEDSWNTAGLRAALVGAGVVEPEADAATVRRRILVNRPACPETEFGCSAGGLHRTLTKRMQHRVVGELELTGEALAIPG